MSDQLALFGALFNDYVNSRTEPDVDGRRSLADVDLVTRARVAQRLIRKERPDVIFRLDLLGAVVGIGWEAQDA